MYLRTLPVRVWWIIIALAVGLGLLFFFALGRVAGSSVTDQLLNHEQLVARAQTSNISSFFQVFGKSVAVFAQLRSTKDRNVNLKFNMNAFVEQWRESGLIGGVVVTDKDGIVQYNSNVLGTSDVGADLSDRVYFVWARTGAKEGDYFIGVPVISRLGATKGQYIVPAASPIYKDGKFTGVVSASVKFDPLTARYFELMKVSDVTKEYVLDSKGNVIYKSSKGDTEDQNISKILADFQVKSALGTTNEGKARIENLLVAYSPIPLGGQNLMLVTASPVVEVSKVTTPIYIRLITVLLLTYITILIFGEAIGRELEAKKDKLI